MWNIAFMIFGIVLLQKGYEANRTNSFISLDRTAGDCLEVPQTVTGSFINDANGIWNTNSRFKFSLSQSMVTLLGLTYTTEQWKQNMQEIENQVLAVVSKTPFRDFSWNIIAWSSYKAVYTTSGRLEFAFDASSSTIFNKDYPAMGLGNANGVLNQDIGNPSTCSQLMVIYLFNIYNFIINNIITKTVSYDPLTSTLQVNLPIGQYNNTYLCSDGTSPPCTSVSLPCKNIGITLQSLGYDTVTSQSTTLQMDFDMVAVSTALAINFGNYIYYYYHISLLSSIY